MVQWTRSEVKKIMNQDFIKNVNDHPFEKQRSKELHDKFWIEEVFTNKESCITGEIRCGLQGDDNWNGDVEVTIDINRFVNEHHAGFGYLEVPFRIGGNGIGTMLMLSVIDVIREFKMYYSINDTVTVSGWLSTSDKQNGNWNKSVPLYEKVGKLSDVESYFTIKDDENHYTAKEFLSRADVDGYIVYVI